MGLFDAQIAEEESFKAQEKERDRLRWIAEYVPRFSWKSDPIILCPMSEWLLVGGSEESRAIHDKAASDALAFVRRCIKTTTPMERDALYEWLFLRTQEAQVAAVKEKTVDDATARRMREYGRGNQFFRDYCQSIVIGNS